MLAETSNILPQISSICRSASKQETVSTRSSDANSPRSETLFDSKLGSMKPIPQPSLVLIVRTPQEQRSRIQRLDDDSASELEQISKKSAIVRRLVEGGVYSRAAFIRIITLDTVNNERPNLTIVRTDSKIEGGLSNNKIED
uniref:Uncharacterized protein n=1 Tax=Romanomermis culicivorax TaxID=13658 RepID=A0A915JV49_ROMCU